MNLILFLHILPFIGSLLLFFVPRRMVNLAGFIALFFSITEFIVSFAYLEKGIKLIFDAALGITLVFSYDKLSAIIILVISGVTSIAILYSIALKQQPERLPSFYSLILMILFGTTAVALSHDLIQFYVFWELMLIPAWILVMYWNEDPVRARYISLKFFIITHIGAVLMLGSILWIYTLTGTTNITSLKFLLSTLPSQTITIMAVLLIMGFIVKLAIFPFHSWLPDTYTSSVMPVTLILVGVMTNMGIYGFARFLPLFPLNIIDVISFPLLILALITMFYGGILALVEKNVKRLVAYSSISQMGYVLFGFATLLPSGFAGSVFNIINQAATKLTLFMCLGIVYEHSKTWNIDALSGWAKRLPFVAICATIAMLSLVGAPPILGFWPELLTFQAGFLYGNFIVASLALVATVISVAYGLRLIRKVFFGTLSQKDEGGIIIPKWTSVITLLTTVLILIILGVYPSLGFSIVKQAISSLGFFLGN